MSFENPSPIEDSPIWQKLVLCQQELSKQTISKLFKADPERFDAYSLQAPELFFDYSKHLLDGNTLDLLLRLAEEAGLAEGIAALFAGAEVNNTEGRPALHTALRSPAANKEEEQAVHATLNAMEAFVTKVQSGECLGYSNKSITDIVNIGIGGSDLGPAMAYAALAPFHAQNINCHFVSNVDPQHLQQTLSALNPERTLFIIASKTFTTLETLQNAQAARRWVLSATNSEATLAKHFVAVSSNTDKAQEFGIAPENIFPMWDWVGGRYSLWSAIGLPIALGTSMKDFRDLLTGAHAMDEHFRTCPLKENMPVIMALLNIWYFNFFHAESQVILPYIQNLHLFPAFLQQLDMESLGKSVRRNGNSIGTASGGIIWGAAGTNGQHSFHQLLHQGSHLIPADFIACANSLSDEDEQHQHLLANCFAQSQALMQGKSLQAAKTELAVSGLSENEIERLAAHKVVSGNKPSSTILMNQLNPKALGALVAAYEHKVFTQSVVLGLNAFDQWGVELGKVLSKNLHEAISKDDFATDFDSSTNGLINYCKTHK